ncbi:MAG: type II 3-dehydroquinate dehydratase [Candidatus Paracaedibacteraceae bacterium]|nr:type II 3-dehydroquinate dehydratase [Candidatus Paracaedibacteraceae bacterium]
MFKIWVLNGPNLNLIGERGKIYGDDNYEQLTQTLAKIAESIAVQLTCLQSNSEGQLIDWIQAARHEADGIILNAGGYTHTSVALHDALDLLDKPKIEVHITNIYARESFRQKSLLSPVVNAVIAGFGQKGYILALEHMITTLKAQDK